MRTSRLLSTLALALAGGLLPVAAQAPHQDHHEFEAYLAAPFTGQGGEGRTFRMGFDFHTAREMGFAAWRLELVRENGQVLRTWHGETFLSDRGRGEAKVQWDGRDARGKALPAGFYTLRLSAGSVSERRFRTLHSPSQEGRVAEVLEDNPDHVDVQEVSLRVGQVPAPRPLPFTALPVGEKGRRAALAVKAGKDVQALAVGAAGSLPYTVYYGNMHAQTNHSDGGGSGDCHSEQGPQSGLGGGPAQAYEMMRTQAGGDFMLASEHNHMYDGNASSTDTSASVANAKNLFASGLAAAAQYRADHPDFVALYGNEWGTANSTNGHLNLINPDVLCTWEKDASNQLFGDEEVAKGDYPTLYQTMKRRGWIGQFNHPSGSQFNSLAYDAAGDEVMVLCEVRNSPAFSNVFNETDTLTSGYESTYKAILSKGFHVAPTSNQDNHCANWGLSSKNRTGVLLPTGQPFTHANFIAALRARRVFATTDRTGQIALTANGHIMGERFNNSGPLTLNAYYASTAGHTAARIEFYQGARGVAVSSLSDGPATFTTTPTPGDHFYYAKITQEDGSTLWSAPVWVNQGAATSTVTAAIAAPAADQTVASGTTVSFSGSATSTAGGALTYLWDFKDGATATAAAASHTFTNTGASAVSYAVSFTATDVNGAADTQVRTITVNPQTSAVTAAITAPSADLTVVSGTALTFTGSGTSSAGNPLSYLWDFKDGGTAPTASASHTFTNTGTAALTYAVSFRATDTVTGSSATQVRNVTVNPAVAPNTAPTITGIANQTINAGASTAALAFTVGDAQTAAGTLAVTAVSFNTTLLPASGIVLGGSGANRTVTLTPAAGQSGSATLTLTVTDGGGLTASTSFTLTVNPISGGVFQEVESNGTIATANAVARTYTGIRGTMGNTTDKDHFAVSLAANEKLKVDMTGPTGTTYDYDLALLDAAGATLASSAGSTTTESLSYTNGAAPKTVYARVISYKGSSTSIPYNLVLTYTAGTTSTELLGNGSFETGATTWSASSGVITNDAGEAAHGGSWKAWLNGYGSAHTDTLSQQVSIPASATSATLSFWLHIDTAETTTTSAWDTLKVQVRSTAGAVLGTLATYSNLNANTGYALKTFDLGAWKGQTVQIYFEGVEGGVNQTSFVVDDASVLVK